MSKSMGRYGPAHPLAGKMAEGMFRPLIIAIGSALKFYHPKSPYALGKGQELRERIGRGESLYLIGIGPAGHNSAAALVEISKKNGIRPICNNEEERYTAINDDGSFPAHSLKVALNYLEDLGVKPDDLFAVVASWDYVTGISTSVRVAMEEAPASFLLLRKAASPPMNPWHFLEALGAPKRLKATLNSRRRVPVIGMRHHDNHACFPYAVSPFAKSSKPTMIVVMDGFGDDGSISLYLAEKGQVNLIRRYHDIFDSLGLLYAIISSTQGGWTTLSSEGRYMGASAWGDTNRLTNAFYRRLRSILHFGKDGWVHVNKSLINYNRRGQEKPYGKLLVEILGEPITPKQMWNPDCVLDVDDIEHAPITQERVDKAAAMQLVFEDALVHIVDHLITTTGSSQLVLSGGTALNCVANMNLLKFFDHRYYLRKHKKRDTRLHLWVPPNPSDTGTAMGAVYQFAMRNDAPLGHPMKHAFICGAVPTSDAIEAAIDGAEETKSLKVGNISDQKELAEVAELVASVVANNGILGVFQGTAETGPRALGHRSILANPCNPETRDTLNSHVKYRERIRPLAPMLTLKEAKHLYHLSEGASDDDYNAYNYMVLTVEAKKEHRHLIPAVVHHDGTSRIQIARPDADPLTHGILEAMGRRVGVEVLVNTSLNVGTPIVQTPVQAINALHRSRGLTGLLMVGDDGSAYLVWHDIEGSLKDSGRQLMQWVEEWERELA